MSFPTLTIKLETVAATMLWLAAIPAPGAAVSPGTNLDAREELIVAVARPPCLSTADFMRGAAAEVTRRI